MRTLTLALFIILCSVCFGQQTGELGVHVGASKLYGDLSNNLSGSISKSFGIFYQHNLNRRYSLKLPLNYNTYAAEGTIYSSPAVAENISVSTNNIDFSPQFVFYFLPFNFKTLKMDNFTPYISGGIGINYNIGSNSNQIFASIPLSIGIKFMVNDIICIGFEHRMNKIFHDDLDNIGSSADYYKNSLIHNNDWCSFTGIFISCKVFEERERCPAYIE